MIGHVAVLHEGRRSVVAAKDSPFCGVAWRDMTCRVASRRGPEQLRLCLTEPRKSCVREHRPSTARPKCAADLSHD